MWDYDRIHKGRGVRHREMSWARYIPPQQTPSRGLPKNTRPYAGSSVRKRPYDKVYDTRMG